MSDNDDDNNSEYSDDITEPSPTIAPTLAPKINTNVYISIVVASVIIASPFIIYNFFFKSSASTSVSEFENKFNILQTSLFNIENKMTDVDKKISSLSGSSDSSSLSSSGSSDSSSGSSDNTTNEKASMFNLFGNIGQKPVIPPVSTEQNSVSATAPMLKPVSESLLKPEPTNLNKNTDESLYSLFGYNPATAANANPNANPNPNPNPNPVATPTIEKSSLDFLSNLNPFSTKVKEEEKIEPVVEQGEESGEPVVGETGEPLVGEESGEQGEKTESPILSSDDYLPANTENPFTEKKGGKTKNKKQGRSKKNKTQKV